MTLGGKRKAPPRSKFRGCGWVRDPIGLWRSAEADSPEAVDDGLLKAPVGLHPLVPHRDIRERSTAGAQEHVVSAHGPRDDFSTEARRHFEVISHGGEEDGWELLPWMVDLRQGR